MVEYIKPCACVVNHTEVGMLVARSGPFLIVEMLNGERLTWAREHVRLPDRYVETTGAEQ